MENGNGNGLVLISYRTIFYRNADILPLNKCQFSLKTGKECGEKKGSLSKIQHL